MRSSRGCGCPLWVGLSPARTCRKNEGDPGRTGGGAAYRSPCVVWTTPTEGPKAVILPPQVTLQPRVHLATSADISSCCHLGWGSCYCYLVGRGLGCC